jgi:hypothetical protein
MRDAPFATANFGEIPFHALGCIRLVALLEERIVLDVGTGATYRARSGVVTAGLRPFLRASVDSCRASATPVLDHLGSVRPLARAFGLCHGAVVEQRPKYPPDDRTKDVEPETRKVPSNDHRSERARRVDRPPGHRPRDEDPYR